MRERLKNLLESEFGYPVRLQGSFAPNEAYPPAFFTIWNNDSNEWHPYDNAPTRIEKDFTVNFYSTDPDLVLTITEKAIQALKDNGWILTSRGRDVAADEPTYTGRTFDAVFLDPKTVPD